MPQINRQHLSVFGHNLGESFGLVVLEGDFKRLRKQRHISYERIHWQYEK